VYIQTEGPQFETPAEIRFMAALGADAVGMSTVPEAIAACHCGMEIAGISCISNLAAGISETPLSVEDITQTAQKAVPQMLTLMKNIILEISKL
jgi:purine-nucleoside phosphorylase